MDCGGRFHPWVMEFDHREGHKKAMDVSRAIRKSLVVLRREAAKCDLVCANCHRMRTYKRLSPTEQLRLW